MYGLLIKLPMRDLLTELDMHIGLDFQIQGVSKILMVKVCSIAAAHPMLTKMPVWD